jgi:DNA-binding IclR family transcriptional regulator
MDRLTGNKRLVYQELQRRGGGRVSLGTLACLCGCHKNTVKNAVHEMAARGLLRVESGHGRPNCYELF